jgi:alpha/beta superfamily hydrolase
MPLPPRARALAPFLVVALLAGTPQTQHAASAPPAPPNGTYVYALSRNGTDQGTTTVTVYRRDDTREIEVDEAGSIGAVRMHATGSYRYDDLGLVSYVATYQAPFLRTSPLGIARRIGTANGFYDQTTFRYRSEGDGPDGARAVASVDGGPSLPPPAPLPRESGAPREHYLFDAPFMASVLMLPAFRHRSDDEPLAPVSPAFGATGDMATAAMRLVRIAPHAPKTPRADVALQIDGIATIWFDRGNDLVHEAHFDNLNLDARLVSYVRFARPAPFEPAPTPTPDVVLAGEPITFESHGVTLAGVVDMPRTVAAKHLVPIVAFIPPGPNANRNFGGDGPNPMYPDLARAFAARGYATLRYDTRGIGHSGGSSIDQTWEDALADAGAAIGAAADQDGIDPKNIYVAGYGNGADLALAAAETTDADVAGAIALAPTVVSYAACARQLAEADAGARTPQEKAKADADFAKTAGRIDRDRARITIDGVTYAANDGIFAKTSYGHDPSALAVRTDVPLFVLHPGLPTCAETREQIAAYDDRLRAANSRATIVVANDLSQVFGGRYDADAPSDTEAFFPYRFDASTAGAIADWLGSAKIANPVGSGTRAPGPTMRAIPPPPPPPTDSNADRGSFANPHPPRPVPTLPPPSPTPAAPGQPGLPATLGSPVPTVTPAPVPS